MYGNAICGENFDLIGAVEVIHHTLDVDGFAKVGIGGDDFSGLVPKDGSADIHIGVLTDAGEGHSPLGAAFRILGGVSINGGKGKVDGVFLGFLAMSIITYFISLLPGLSVWSDALQGAIIIAAVVMNLYTERSAAKRALKERGALI